MLSQVDKKANSIITEYEIKFILPDIGSVPDNFRELLNILERLGMTDYLVKVEESTEYDLSKPGYPLSRKALFGLVIKGE